jgi:DNA mismatch endonuclease (patch repair protein)
VESSIKSPSTKLITHTTPQDQRRMAQVKSEHTTPELVLRQYLHAAGFRYRLHDKSLPGKPDVVLPKYRAVVFVQGCFWHGHGATCLRGGKPPKANADFWQAKFAYNRERDQRNQAELQAAGWQVFVVWECELRKSERGATLHRLTTEILTGANELNHLQSIPDADSVTATWS